MITFRSFLDEKNKGLWHNIHAKRKRGEKPNPPGHPDRPTKADFERSQKKESVQEEKHPALKRAGVSGFSKPKRTPGHPTKSHVVVVKDGDKVKTIRFGQQGVTTAGEPKKGESDRQKNRRKSFKARHAKNIAKGKTSAAYWANKEKW